MFEDQSQREIKNKDEEISKMLFSFIDDWFITEYFKKTFLRINEFTWIT
jgi:hypothetical protein